ncbi:MAG TPA: hypothetical protein VMV03_12630 [Spirochaetia bacterium]|nr:hypothetical protein [Spirochaetia bacterium]
MSARERRCHPFGALRIFVALGGTILAAAIPGAVPAAAQPAVFEWAAALESAGTLIDHGVGPVLDSLDSLSASISVSHDLGPGTMTYTAGAGLFYMPQRLLPGQGRLDAFLVYPSAVSIAWDLEPARLVDPWFRVVLGRMEAREPSGLLLENPYAPAQLLDGLSLEFRWKNLYAGIEAGYLGLLDKRINRIIFTLPDALELADTSHYGAPPRGLAILRLEADDLLVGQSVGLFGIWQKDFRQGPPQFDSWYIGALVNGPIVPLLRQASTVVVGISVPAGGSGSAGMLPGITSGAGLLISSQVAYKLPGTLLHEAWFSVLWASSPGSGLQAFPALAGPPVSLAYTEPLSDVVKLELGADAVLPVTPTGAVLKPSLAVRLLLAPSSAVPSDLSFSSAGPYVGTEIETVLEYVPLRGFNVSAHAGGLIAVQGILPCLRLDAGIQL